MPACAPVYLTLCGKNDVLEECSIWPKQNSLVNVTDKWRHGNWRMLRNTCKKSGHMKMSGH